MKIVVAITGGGVLGVGEYLKHGGKSAHLLEVHVPYSKESLIDFIHGEPDKYCSEDCAANLAAAAFQRAFQLDSSLKHNEVTGIGVTCSLKAINEREGRRHRCYIGIQTSISLWVISVELVNTLTREEQEIIIGELLEHILHNADGSEQFCYEIGLFSRLEFKDTGIDYYYPDCEWGKYKVLASSVYNDKHADLCVRKQFENQDDYFNIGILSSSFNPCHETHIAMAKYVKEKYNIPVWAELSVTNYEKPPVNYKSLQERISSIPTDVFDNLIINNYPLFADKVLRYQNATFILGMDTINRLDYDSLDTLIAWSQRVIVFPRINNNGELIPYMGPNAFKYKLIFADDFNPNDVSSRKIRAQKV